MNIKGKIVTLRAIEETDLNLLHKWANDPEIQDIMGVIHFPSSMDFHRLWFQNLKSDLLNQRFAINMSGIGLIGISSLMSIDWRNNNISYSFYCNKLGWKEEGLRRNWYFRRGRYWDQIIVGITKKDYEQLVQKTRYWD